MTVVGINAAATPPLNDTVVVIITVLDVNEFPPMFVSPPNRVNVSEFFIPVNEPVLQLTATDMDYVSLFTALCVLMFNLVKCDCAAKVDQLYKNHIHLLAEVVATLNYYPCAVLVLL